MALLLPLAILLGGIIKEGPNGRALQSLYNPTPGFFRAYGILALMIFVVIWVVDPAGYPHRRRMRRDSSDRSN